MSTRRPYKDLPRPPGGPGASDARSEDWLMTTGARAAAGTPDGSAAEISGRADASTAPAPAADSRVPSAQTFPTNEVQDDRKPPTRRGTVDPVKALMHRHRALCTRAVDPLEIAAELEAHGVTDRTAARFRHRDVFSLAEEMYARVPRDGETAPAAAPDVPAAAADVPTVSADRALLALLPGALCAAAVTGLRLTEGQTRLLVAVVGALAVALGLRVTLRRGPLHITRAWRTTTGTRAWTCWLLVYAVLGDGLLSAGIAGGPIGLPNGGPNGPWPMALASVLALTLACAPAAWCVHLFAVRARRRLAASRGLEEFTASVKPLLLGMFGLFLCALGGLLALCRAVLGESVGFAQAAGLGALLLPARLLTAHGFPHAPAVVLAAVGATEATALATAFAGRLPGCSFLAVPVETAVGLWGPGVVPALVCGAAALVLLVHATSRLTRASAHADRVGTP